MADEPKRKASRATRVTKGAPEPAPGKVLKVIGVDSNGEKTGEWSHQSPVDPFDRQYQAAGLMEPPFAMEQLVFLAEQHPTHSAALEQKAVDVVGTGWEWRRDDEKADEDTEQRDQLEEWFKSLADDDETDSTTHEILLSAWNDVETLGQGFIELARDSQGKLRHWFHVPGHTCRFHNDGKRIAQIRQGKRVWFKRWLPNDKTQVDRVSGAIGDSVKQPANEMLVLKRPTRRSSWYGVPVYVPAIGWITLSTAARDDNLLFFENRREPRWAIVLENVEDDPELEEQLRQALQVDLKQPHRNLLVPLSGPAKIHFQQLGDNKGDMSWEKLQDRADASILLGHRMPGERIGMVRVGALGGSTVAESGRVYKESFVQTSQALLAARINKLITAESGVGESKWLWHPEELELAEAEQIQSSAVGAFQGGIAKLNEAREMAGLDPLELVEEEPSDTPEISTQDQAPGEPGTPTDDTKSPAEDANKSPIADEEGAGAEEPKAKPDPRGQKFFWELAPGAAAAGAAARVGGQMGAEAGIDQAQLEQSQNQLAARIRSILTDQEPTDDAPIPTPGS